MKYCGESTVENMKRALILAAAVLFVLLCGCQATPDADVSADTGSVDGSDGGVGGVVEDESAGLSHQFESVADIGGEDVAYGELMLFMSDDSEYSRDKAMDELRPYIICRRELKARGGAEYGDYSEFYYGWQAENARRAAAAANGDVVYGPESLTQRVYYDYRHQADMELLFSLAADDDSAQPTEEALLSAYNERTDLFTLMGEVNMRVILLSNDDDVSIVSELRAALEAGESYDGASERLGLSDKTYERQFDESSFREPDVTEFDGVADAIMSTPVGEFSEPIDNHGEGYIVLYCENREGAGRRPFEECRDELADILIEENFESRFAEMTDTAKIEWH